MLQRAPSNPLFHRAGSLRYRETQCTRAQSRREQQANLTARKPISLQAALANVGLAAVRSQPLRQRRAAVPLGLDRPAPRPARYEASASASAGQAASASDGSWQQLARQAESPRPRAPLDNQYLVGVAWRQKKKLSIAAACLLLCVSSNLASPVLSGWLFELLVNRMPLGDYGKLLGVLAAMYITEPILSAAYVHCVCKAADEAVFQIRCEVFRVLLLQRISFFDMHNSSELGQLVGQEVEALRTFVYSNVTRDRGLRALLEAIGACVVLFAISWRLGPVMALVIGATGATVALYRLQTRAAEAQKAAALARVTAVAQQAFSNIRTVRIYNGEAFERERFLVHARDGLAHGSALAGAKTAMELLNRGCIHVSLLALYGLGGYLVSSQLLPVSALLTGIGFTYSLVYATQGIVQTAADLRRVSASVQRVQALLASASPDPAMNAVLPPGAWWDEVNTRRAALADAAAVAASSSSPTSYQHEKEKQQAAQAVRDEAAAAAEASAAASRNGSGRAELVTTEAATTTPSSSSSSNRAVLAAERGPLELRDIYFSYPLRPHMTVLSGLSLILPQGTITAVVGRSGSGKSTVAALLSRFYQPDRGAIYLGGTPANEFTQAEWSRAVATVSQEPVLFNGTIADNIAYGNLHGASQEEVEAAAKAANAHDFIVQLPDGYHTVVGEGGTLLSGGQRQRVAIARALLKDSPILILDEATSALDAKSERLVQAAIERLVKGRTVLVIAHRLSTVQAAHQIVVLEEGHVVEVGTHKELVKQGGMYAELISSQSLSLNAV